MIRTLASLILILGLLLSCNRLMADEGLEAMLRVSVNQQTAIWMGQQVTINLDLVTNGVRFSDTQFSPPAIQGAFLMQVDSTTIKLNERNNGQNWQILRYPLALYPQKSGQLEIPSFSVRFSTSASFTGSATAFSLRTEPLILDIRIPDGVKEGDMVISTSSFELDYSWRPDTTSASTGDAFTLTITRTAADISGMLLPPVPVFEQDGLASYPQTPDVQDSAVRGSLTGKRSDSITWIAEKPGQYQIPGVRFQWWDPVRQQLEQRVIPGLNLDVRATTGATASLSVAAQSAEDQAGQWIRMALIIALLTCLGSWLMLRHRKPGRTRYDEKAAFTELAKACRSNQPEQVYADIHRWLPLFLPTASITRNHRTLEMFADEIGDEQLRKILQTMQQAIIKPGTSWHGRELLKVLQGIRHRGTQSTMSHYSDLPLLNPGP